MSASSFLWDRWRVSDLDLTGMFVIGTVFKPDSPHKQGPSNPAERLGNKENMRGIVGTLSLTPVLT